MKVLESENPSPSQSDEITQNTRIRVALEDLANHDPEIWLLLAICSIFSLLNAQRRGHEKNASKTDPY